MKIILVPLLTMLCSLFVSGCASRRISAHDYVFDISGSVAAEDGAPLQEVEVILETNTPVYEGVRPVSAQRLITSKGVFIFRCLTHSPTMKYSLTFRKEGFETQGVSGSYPPNGNYVIKLKKLGDRSLGAGSKNR